MGLFIKFQNDTLNFDKIESISMDFAPSEDGIGQYQISFFGDFYEYVWEFVSKEHAKEAYDIIMEAHKRGEKFLDLRQFTFESIFS